MTTHLPNPLSVAPKEQLRRLVRHSLEQVTEIEHRQNSSLLVQKLTDYLTRRFPQARRIASFAALPHEPDLSLLVELLPQRQFFYPLVTSPTEMSFHLVTNLSTLSHGAFGILEPNPQKHPPVLPEDIDLVLVPGLAYDLQGNRLGQGNGYYDRFLEKIPTTPTIGIAYGVQLLHCIPSEPHDREVAYLATERGIIPV